MRYLALITIVLLFTACNIVQGAKLEQAVLDALAKDERTAQYEFAVSRQDDGTILITGKVFKAEELNIVMEIAKSVPGVDKVVNNCSLEETGSGMMQDEYVDLPFT